MVDLVNLVASTASTSSEDTFADAFAQLLEDEVGAVTVLASTAPAASTAPEASTAPADNQPAKTAEDLAAEAEAAALEAAKTPEQKAADVAAAEAKAATDAAAATKATEDAQRAAAQAAQDAEDARLARFAEMIRPSTAAIAASTAPPPPMFSPQELEVLAAYDKEFPDVARAEMIRRRAEYRQLTGYIFDQVSTELAKQFREQVAPIQAIVQGLSTRTHLGDLHTQIPDYEKERDVVIAWTKTQPAYLQPAFDHVIREGTIDEVKDLINRYKQSTGVSTPALSAGVASTAAVASTAKPAVELSPAAKKAAAALAPVAAKRTVAVAATSSDDFDGAFAEAAKL